MQGVERYKVRLLPHDEGWAREFVRAKAEIEGAWGAAVVEVQHIGSTAITGSWAKPILDVAVVLRSFSEMDVGALTALGYDFCGLQKPDNDRYLYVLRGEGQISLRHIHVYEPGNRDFLDCVGFRDYLNSHPEEARAYSDLKRSLAVLYPDDRIAYTEGKEAFVRRIYAGLPHNQVNKGGLS